MEDRFFDNWSTQLRKGMLELCILNAIDGTRLYGYDIVRRLREIDALVVSEGTLFKYELHKKCIARNIWWYTWKSGNNGKSTLNNFL